MSHNNSGRRKALAEFWAIPMFWSCGTDIKKFKDFIRMGHDMTVNTIHGEPNVIVFAGDSDVRVEVYHALYFVRTGTNLNRIFHLPIVLAG